MTTKEKFIEILEEMGLDKNPTATRAFDLGGKEWGEYPCEMEEGPPGTTIAIGSGEDGYSMFFAEFHFDAEGEYIEHGVKE